MQQAPRVREYSRAEYALLPLEAADNHGQVFDKSNGDVALVHGRLQRPSRVPRGGVLVVLSDAQDGEIVVRAANDL